MVGALGGRPFGNPLRLALENIELRRMREENDGK